jgi:hypothetical protein
MPAKTKFALSFCPNKRWSVADNIDDNKD